MRIDELEEVIAGGEIIEDYPVHQFGPACLVYGRTALGKVLHVVCSLRETVDVITLYEPDREEWEDDLKTRKKIQP